MIEYTVDDERAVLHKVAWRLLPFLGLLYFVSFIDRVNIGFAALTMNADLGFSSTVYGLGAGIFFLGYVLFEVPSNVILARIGARRWIARIMVTWGVLAVAMAWVQGPASFYVLRFLLGVAEAGFFPGIILYLTYWFPAQHRGRIIGAFMVALPVSSVLGAPLSTAILDVDWMDIKGWQWLFILEGIPAVALGFVVWKFIPDRPEQARWLADSERRVLVGALVQSAAGSSSDQHLSLLMALTSARVWLLGVVYLGVVVGVYGLGFWLPQIIQGFGALSHIEVGLLTAVPYLAAAIAMYAWGRRSDRFAERRWHFIGAAFVGAAALVSSGFLLGSPALALSLLTVGAVGMYSSLPVFWTLPTRMLQGIAAAGGIALINAIGNCGGLLGPIMIGYIKESTGAYRASLWLLGGCLAIAGVLVWKLRLADLRPRSNKSSSI